MIAMDDLRFDTLTRKLGASRNRRSALRLAGAGFAASLIPALAPANETEAEELAAANCVTVGKRCGRKNQPRCEKCCTRYTTKKGRQKRCTCRPDLNKCSRSDQCCSGICGKVPCLGINRKRCLPGLIFGDPGGPTCSAVVNS